jgi:hypothetical protein
MTEIQGDWLVTTDVEIALLFYPLNPQTVSFGELRFTRLQVREALKSKELRKLWEWAAQEDV